MANSPPSPAQGSTIAWLLPSLSWRWLRLAAQSWGTGSHKAVCPASRAPFLQAAQPHGALGGQDTPHRILAVICDRHLGGKRFLCLDIYTCCVSRFSSKWGIASTQVSSLEGKPFASREQGVVFDPSLRVPGVGPQAQWAANTFINEAHELLWMPAESAR